MKKVLSVSFVLVLAITLSLSFVSAHEINSQNHKDKDKGFFESIFDGITGKHIGSDVSSPDPDFDAHEHFLGFSDQSGSAGNVTLDFSSSSFSNKKEIHDLFSQGEDIYVDFNESTDSSDYPDEVYEVMSIENSVSNNVGVVVDLNYSSGNSKNSDDGGVVWFEVSDSELSTDSGDDSCSSENFILNESIGSNYYSVSCLNAYDSDSRCVAGTCRACVDFDSDDLESGNPTEKGYTWNNSQEHGQYVQNKGGVSDYCINSTHLMEFSCAGSTPSNDAIVNQTYDCRNLPNEAVPFKCENGACVCEPVLDYKSNSCGDNDKAKLVDAKCNILDDEIVDCDYQNKGVIGDAGSFDNVKIDGNELDLDNNYTNTGVRRVEIEKDGQKIGFDWDTKDTGNTPADVGDELNLRNISLKYSGVSDDFGYMIVQGLKKPKTVYVDNVMGSNEVCVVDSEGVNSIGSVTADCSGPGELLLSCPGGKRGYNCEIEGDKYKVWTLQSSAVREVDSSVYSNNVNNQDGNGSDGNGSDDGNFPFGNGDSNGDGSDPDATSGDGSEDNNDGIDNGGTNDGGTSNAGSSCTASDWSCTPSDWSDVPCEEGEKKRSCVKSNDCSGGVSKDDVSTQSCSSSDSSDDEDSESYSPWMIILVIAGAVFVVIIVVALIVKNK